MSILEMRDKLRAKTKEARRLVDNNGDQDRLDAVLDEIEELRGKIERGEKASHLEELESWAKSGGDVSADEKPELDTRGIFASRTTRGEHVQNRITVGEDRSYRALFGAPKKNSDYRDFSDFVQAVTSGRTSDRLHRSMVEGIPSDGGFSVPQEMRETIWNHSLGKEIVRPRALVTGMTSNQKKVPAAVLGDHSSNLFGGLIGYWGEEAADMTETSPKLRDVGLNAEKLYLYTEVSNEWLSDSPDSTAFLERAFSGALGWNLDKAFIRGDGAGKPLGVLNAPCVYECSKEGAQTAGTFQYENATTMLGHLMPGSYDSAVWLIHPSCVEEVLEMGFSVGSGGSKIETLNPKTGKLQILGLDVIVTEFCNTLGTAGDVILADFSKYIIGLRDDFRLESSSHLKFQSDESAFRSIVRVDGSPIVNETLTLRDGSTEVSPFITVETRS